MSEASAQFGVRRPQHTYARNVEICTLLCRAVHATTERDATTCVVNCSPSESGQKTESVSAGGWDVILQHANIVARTRSFHETELYVLAAAVVRQLQRNFWDVYGSSPDFSLLLYNLSSARNGLITAGMRIDTDEELDDLCRRLQEEREAIRSIPSVRLAWAKAFDCDCIVGSSDVVSLGWDTPICRFVSTYAQLREDTVLSDSPASHRSNCCQ